jgi:hypothetical protein
MQIYLCARCRRQEGGCRQRLFEGFEIGSLLAESNVILFNRELARCASALEAASSIESASQFVRSFSRLDSLLLVAGSNPVVKRAAQA